MPRVSHWNRLAVLGPLALLVTGGVAAVYRGPVPPVNAADANAALKAARSHSHVMFDPTDYAGDGKPADNSAGYLAQFKPDLSYYRNRILQPVPNSPDPSGKLISSAASNSPADPPAPPEPERSEPTFFELVRTSEGGRAADLTHLLDPHFQLAGIPAGADGNLTSDDHAKVSALANAIGARTGASSNGASSTEDSEGASEGGEGLLNLARLARIVWRPSLGGMQGAEALSFSKFDVEPGSSAVPPLFPWGALLPYLTDILVMQPGSIGSSTAGSVNSLSLQGLGAGNFSVFLGEEPAPTPEPGTLLLIVLGIFATIYLRSPRV